MGEFVISVVVENGQPHYEIWDKKRNKVILCNENELNKFLEEHSNGKC